MKLLQKGFFTLLILVVTSGCVSTGQKNSDPQKAAQLYADLGVQYLRQGNLELSLIKLKHALELDSENADANHYIAELYKQMGNKELAQEYFKKAVRYDDNNPMLLNNYGAFLCEQGQLDESEKYFLRAAKVPSYRTPELAYENLALCAMKSDNNAKAEEYFRKALKIRPTLPQSLYQMALLSYQQGEYLQARAFIQRFYTIGKTRQSLELGIRIEEALGDKAAADKYRKELSAKTSDTK
jgi:type IV pilus assembly protein PilF